MSDRDVVIVSACRTPVGRLLGGLSTVRPDDLAALALREAVERVDGLEAADVDEVILGCANQAGEDNRNVARMALLLAGFPQSVPGYTVNRLCASGLESVNHAARMIRTDDADIVVAGGVESMSRAPWVMGKPIGTKPVGNQTMFDTSLGWRFPNPAMEALFPLEAMGVTAENLADRYGLSREEQDAFALQSHVRAAAAEDAGRFDAERFAVRVPQGRKGTLEVSTDEGVRRDTSMESLAGLRPVFRKGGSVTAGNSSTLNDGAAALVLMSREAARTRGCEILATWRSCASAGVDPTVMGIGPVPAARAAARRVGWSIADIDLIELNEAFAAQSLAVMKELELDPARVNVNGGAIALGHPLGCSGARILTGLIYEMIRRDARTGLATLCVGVGQGVATLVERESEALSH